MKKVNLLLVLLFAVTLGFMSSCNPDEPVKPTIVVSETTGATYAQGSVVTYEIVVSSNEDLKTFTVSPSVVGGAGTGVIVTNPADVLTDGNFSSGLNSVTITYAYAIPATGIAVGSEISIEFAVSDNVADNSSSKSFTVVSGAGNIVRFTAVLMGAQASSTGSFLDANTGTVYTQADANTNQDLVDIVYYYGSANAATLCAPNDETVNGGAGFLALCETWTTKNATLFGASSVSATDFDAMTDDSGLVDTGLTDSKVTDLAVDNLIAFETADGKKGLIKVSDLEPNSTGTITIDVLMQE